MTGDRETRRLTQPIPRTSLRSRRCEVGEGLLACGPLRSLTVPSLFTRSRADSPTESAAARGCFTAMQQAPIASLWTARLIHRGQRDWFPALHLAFGLGATPTADTPLPELALFLDTARARGLGIDCVAGTFRDGALVSAALGVSSPGRLAMVLAPWEARGPEAIEELGLSLELVVPALLSRGAQLVEILTPPDAPALGDLLSKLGLRCLTRLVYLRRASSLVGNASLSHAATGADLEWVPFSRKSERLFERTIEATYAQTLDCPELSGVRRMEDVLAGHRAAAEFDPANWFVALRAGTPVGVLLLGGLPAQDALEIVYMGVSQPARGQGVADALLWRAVRSTEERSVKYLALAVDRRNVPARRVYARWGFVETGTRDAWILSASSGDAATPI